MTSIGGVYGASITAEEGNLVSTDDATQIPNALRDEIESVLQAIDTTWDTANPMMDIKGVFDGLNASGQGSGGWTSFVDDASRQPGLGDSAQLWNTLRPTIRLRHGRWRALPRSPRLPRVFDLKPAWPRPCVYGDTPPRTRRFR